MRDRANNAWLSTPLFPTVFSVLFNFGKLPASSFRNFDYLPPDIEKLISKSYAQKYPFYGIFTVTPIIGLSLIWPFLIKRRENRLWSFSLICSLIFGVGVIFNTKVLGFWGGNQYDIRYFYPYVMPLVVITGIVLGWILKKLHGLKRMIMISLCILLTILSIYMSWMGVLSQYKPALTGERKLWIYPLELSSYSQHSLISYWQATFPNGNNFWLPILISIIIISLFWKRIFRKDLI